MSLLRNPRLLLILFQVIVCSGLATAQRPLPTPPPPPILKQTPKPQVQEVDPNDIVKVDTAEVLLPVTVRDRNGRLVEGLTRKDFRVFEEDIEQPLSELSLRQVSVDVVLMVDTSSSVASNLDDFRSAADGFARALDVQDRVSLIQFDDRVQLLQDWTTSRVQFRRSLLRVAPGMFTRFNDAIVLTASEQFQRSSARRAIIILTDGIDSGRGASFEAALKAALGAQAAIYVISNIEIERGEKRAQLTTLLAGTDSAVRFNQLRIDDLRLGLEALEASETKLTDLTKATGGRLYKPRSFNDLADTYAEVASELRHQYAVYYSPLDRTRDGRFRRVRVETTSSEHLVSARAGYFAPAR
ncbi:MAG TPA: VWA domain-containing protein [Pyrinomonadaceae bacterium]|nr:VWA domain-containing protein [Pyrinomonadaceae bacterium]